MGAWALPQHEGGAWAAWGERSWDTARHASGAPPAHGSSATRLTSHAHSHFQGVGWQHAEPPECRCEAHLACRVVSKPRGHTMHISAARALRARHVFHQFFQQESLHHVPATRLRAGGSGGRGLQRLPCVPAALNLRAKFG
jgi:hypothetical protein